MATASYASGGHNPQPPGHHGGAMPPQHGGTGAAPVPDSYFTESRKGEINELRNLLRGFAAERDPQRKRDIIKKVRLVPLGGVCRSDVARRAWRYLTLLS
jgi:hypothetical protein